MEFLAGRGLKVTGVDYHAEFLPAPGDPSRRETYVQGDLTALPFTDARFDTTYCYDVLEHLDDVRALKELVRVTRRRLILAVPAHDYAVVGFNFTFAHYQDLTHFRTYTEKSLGELIRGVTPASFRVFPELPLDFYGIAINHLPVPPRGSGWRQTLCRYYHAALRRLIPFARYPMIYTG